MSLDHAWLKGVPMELRPRYYPKPPLRFKDIDIYIPLDAIENDYDFTEERRVLAECKMWEDDKEKERLAEEERQRLLEEENARLAEEERLHQEELERLRQEEEELLRQAEEERQRIADELQQRLAVEEQERYQQEAEERLRLEEEERLRQQEEQSQQKPVIVPTPSVPFSNQNQSNTGGGGGSILQPFQTVLPAPPSATVGGGDDAPTSASASSTNGTATNSPAGSEKSSSTITTTTQARKIDLNLSDFESDTANPFDHVELKSINDMEVLASVLKNNVTIASPPNVPVPNSHTSTGNGHTSMPTSYMNGGVSTSIPLSYYHPTPVYPPVSQQCPYPPWSQNGYYPPPPPTSTSNTVTSISPNVTSIGSSHIPSPTQAIDSNASQGAAAVNSFTKLQFPFLTSFPQAPRDREREPMYGGGGGYNHRSYGIGQSSTDDIASHPFLSSYVVQRSQVAPPLAPLSHSPMHQQYWPSHFSHQQTNPYTSAPAAPPQHIVTPIHNGPDSSTSAPPPSTAAANFGTSGPSPPSGSQHALR